ncbi:MAG: EAL domain-containing response regulator [Proteobacteria bacterium]|nr:EAL domain-containing response regulator [Pseudomonadota bacterium]
MRLLILDDEVAVGRLLVRVAERAGWEARSTATAGEFQVQVGVDRPDAIMLDLHLGDADGIEQLRFLHGRGYDGTIVLMSGFADRVLDAARELGTSLGLTISAIVAKPATIEEIEAVLAAIQMPDRTAAIEPDETHGAAPSLGPLSAARIDQGMIDGELQLEYQPIVNGKDRAVEEIEALARWHHPTRGLVMPNEFIPISEQDTGVIDRLTMWVVRTANEQSKRIHRLATETRLAVNVSAKNLRSLEFPDQLAGLVAELGAAPSNLTLEITESATTSDPTATMDILTRLRLKGFRLAMDDFGTGFSSLKALVNSPFSEIKIDKSFVANVLASRDARVIVKTVAHLAHDMGLKTVAEGAETQAVVDQLLEFGVDSVQGYHVSRPMPANRLDGWLSEWSAAGRRARGWC